MHKSFKFCLSVVIFCLFQEALAGSNSLKTIDLRNDVLLTVPERMVTEYTNASVSFNAVDVKAQLLSEQESVYPIQFDQTIDVLVIHSPQLPELSIQESIDHIEDLFFGLDIADTALERSGVIGTYRVIDIIEQSFFDDELTQANSNSTEVLSAQRTSNATQNSYQFSGADFILNITNTPRGLAGGASTANVFGTTGDDLNKLVISYPLLGNVGVVQESLSGIIIAHEFGHTLGLRHDRESFPSSDFIVDNLITYGFTDQGRRFGSIMTATGCSSNGCIQPIYSSPDIFIEGVQMGVDESQTDAAHGAKAVRASFQHSAYFNSRFQSANTVWEKTQDGLLLDWPDVIGADHYLLVPRSCIEFDVAFFVDQLANAIQVRQSSALIQNLQDDTEICIVAEKSAIDNQGVSRMLLGGTQLSVSDEHIKMDASIARLSKDSTNLSVGLQLSDPSIDNASLTLSLFYFAQGNINENWFDDDDFEAPQMEVVLNAVMDYSFTGEGTTRQLTMNLKMPFTQISDAFSDVVELPQFVAPLRLRVGYVNESGLPISSHFAINDSMPDTASPKLLSIPKRIENQISSELNFVIENMAMGASISLLPEDGLIVEDTIFEYVQRGDRGRTHVRASVRTESDLEDNVNIAIMLDGIELNEKVVLIPGPINQLPSLNLQIDSVLTVGTDVVVSSNASDADGFIEQYRWSSENGPALSGETLEQRDLRIPNAQAGEYRVNLTVLDDKGSIARQSISFTVGENTSPPEPNPPAGQNESGGGSFTAYSAMFLLLVLVMRLFSAPRFRNELVSALKLYSKDKQALLQFKVSD